MLKLLESFKEIRNIFYIFPFNTLVEQTADSLKEYFKEDYLAEPHSWRPIKPKAPAEHVK